MSVLKELAQCPGVTCLFRTALYFSVCMYVGAHVFIIGRPRGDSGCDVFLYHPLPSVLSLGLLIECRELTDNGWSGQLGHCSDLSFLWFLGHGTSAIPALLSLKNCVYSSDDFFFRERISCYLRLALNLHLPPPQRWDYSLA